MAQIAQMAQGRQRIMADYLAVARRALATLPRAPNTEGSPKPSFEGFAGATPGASQETWAEPASWEGAPKQRVFPHCPRCASYALYRANNIGDYECLTCKLRNITEEVARRTQ
jgi:hypothetical protein